MTQGNFMSNLPREALPNAQEINSSDVPWHLRYGARVLGTVGGLLSIVLGAVLVPWSAITFHSHSVAAGLIEVAVGFFVTLIEAPFLCAFLSFAQRPGDMLEKNKSPFIKGTLYVVLGLLPIMISAGLTTIMGTGLVLLAGVIHIAIGFGRKAPLENMQAAAAAQSASAMEQGVRSPVY